MNARSRFDLAYRRHDSAPLPGQGIVPWLLTSLLVSVTACGGDIVNEASPGPQIGQPPIVESTTVSGVEFSAEAELIVAQGVPDPFHAVNVVLLAHNGTDARKIIELDSSHFCHLSARIYGGPALDRLVWDDLKANFACTRDLVHLSPGPGESASRAIAIPAELIRGDSPSAREYLVAARAAPDGRVIELAAGVVSVP